MDRRRIIRGQRPLETLNQMNYYQESLESTHRFIYYFKEGIREILERDEFAAQFGVVRMGEHT